MNRKLIPLLLSLFLAFALSAQAYVAKTNSQIDTLVAAGYGSLTNQRCSDIGKTVKQCLPQNWNALYALFQANGTSDEKVFAASLFTTGEWNGQTSNATAFGFWDYVLTYATGTPQSSWVVPMIDPATKTPYQIPYSSFSVGGGGGGDASTNTSSSVDGEVALFSGTGGKTLKRSTGSGMAKLTSGVLGMGAAGTDYLAPSAIGTTVQGYDGDLASLAGATGTNTIYYRSGANTFSPVTIGPNMSFVGGTLDSTASGAGIVDTEQAIGNANTAWAATNHVLRQNAALTANRSSALPLAAAYKKGELIVYMDKVTAATSAFSRAFTPAGSDTVNGGVTYTPFKGSGTMTLESDGVSAWTSINDTAAITMLQDPTDPTKLVQYDLSAMGTGESRTVRMLSPATPILTAQAGAGTSPTIGITGDAEAGEISITFGTSPTPGVAIVHVAATYPVIPRTITITPNNPAAIALQSAGSKGVSTGNKATNGWDIIANSTASTVDPARFSSTTASRPNEL